MDFDKLPPDLADALKLAKMEAGIKADAMRENLGGAAAGVKHGEELFVNSRLVVALALAADHIHSMGLDFSIDGLINNITGMVTAAAIDAGMEI